MAVTLLSLTSCGQRAASEDITYTLYRNSPTDESMRIHIATFDATETAKYNFENCDTARDLWVGSIASAKSSVRYWCEKGRFRP